VTIGGAGIVDREPEEPDVGTAEDWRLIEEALGFKDPDPGRRERLWRDLSMIFRQYPPVADAPPAVRSSNYHHALDALRRHAVRLFADLSPSGRLLPPPDGPRIRQSRGIEVCDPETLPAEEGLSDLDLWTLAYLSREILPYDKQQALLAGLAELIGEVDKWKEGLPSDKGGRPMDYRTRGLIYELAQLYHEWSGRKARRSTYPPTHPKYGQPTGPFFHFVKLCLHTFSPEDADLVGASGIGKTGPSDKHGLSSPGDDKHDEALAMTIRRVLKVKHWHRGVSY
jgi:hypothetical protein